MLALLILASLCLSAIALWRDQKLNWQFKAPQKLPDASAARFETLLDYSVASGQAHSPAVQLTQDGFNLYWFQGSKEAHTDVDIYGLPYGLTDAGWQPQADPAPLITRENLGAVFEPSQLVITLGNVTQNDAAANCVFATVVSLGGWAMASIADIRLSGLRPIHARKLNLSPLLGRSHLVKSPMVAYADGSHGLPAYYEVKHVFSELVRFGPDGRVRDKRRMTAGQQAIQPMIVPLDDTSALAFLRNYSASETRQLILRSDDGGRNWTALPDCGLPNPQAPVAALALGDGRILIAFNDHETRPDLFRLALSQDEGQSWRRIHTLEDGDGDHEKAARYPVMRALPCGDILLTYSVGQKRGVRAHLFNLAWINAQ